MTNLLKSAATVGTTLLPWGVAKWLITPGEHNSKMTLGEVIVLPGNSHGWHNHESSDEVIYVLSGEGEFTVGEGNRFPVKTGDAVHIPIGVFHDSHALGWAPLHLLVMYSPGGPEAGTPVENHRRLLAGDPITMHTQLAE